MGKITRKNEDDDIKREDKDKRTMMVNDNLGENTKEGDILWSGYTFVCLKYSNVILQNVRKNSETSQ